MSRNYDNWERLMAAVLKREQLWQLFHSESISSSQSSESSSGYSFSFGLASSLENAPYSSPKWSSAAANNTQDKHDAIGGSTSSVRDDVNDKLQSPVENPTPNKNASSKRFWKRALKIEVPKLIHQNGGTDCSDCPKASPRITSPTVTPHHPRAGKGQLGSLKNWPVDGIHEAYPLPLPPPLSTSNSSLISSRNKSAETSPRTPERAEKSRQRGTLWKKGKLIGSSRFADVYLGFNSEKGAMCAMKEFSLSLAKSKQSAKAFEKEIALLSSFSHPNIVQSYGSETLGDNLYIYYEYLSGGSIYTILKQYGNLGESAIRSYTRQLLAGLAYLHSKSIAHRDIKGANVLLDPSGTIKLTNLFVESHLQHVLQITRQPLSSLLMDSPYWMAPEAIMNSDVCSLHMDIWSLGCTVVEMATSKPPLSKYDGGLAMFKVANNKELPTIPAHLSDEGKDFLRCCFQWNPLHRATASQLLEHPFVQTPFPLVKSTLVSASAHHPAAAAMATVVAHATSVPRWNSRDHPIHSSKASKSKHHSPTYISSKADLYTPRRYISAPVSPVGSPLPHPSSPQHPNRRLSPPLVSAPQMRTLGNGIVAVPYPSILPQATLQMKMPGKSINSPSYWDPNIVRSRHARIPTLPEIAASPGKPLGRDTNCGHFQDPGAPVPRNRLI